jgi:hypothetical protein
MLGRVRAREHQALGGLAEALGFSWEKRGRDG